MNRHMIHGRLARDPELTRGAEEKNDRVNFTVAVNRRYGDEADFIDCVAFGKRAGVIEKYFSKGSEIVLEGEGHVNSYEGRDGIKRRSYSITVENFDFCGSKSDSRNNSSASRENEARALEEAANSLFDMPDNFEAQEDDIPF